MNDSMKLYYGNESHEFSLVPSNKNEVVYDANQGGKDIKIKDGDNHVFRVRIRTTSTKAPKREYVYVDIYINNVLLLPLSLSCRKADTRYPFREFDIIFQQWGAGQTKNRSAHTIMQKDEEISWDVLLSQICEICNNYESWIIHEVNQLIVLLETNNENKFWDISTFIELTRRYEDIVPSIIPVIHKFVDKYCFEAMKKIVDFTAEHKMQNKDIQHKIKCGDIIWNYIKDYILVQVPKET